MTRIDRKLEQACINSARDGITNHRHYYWRGVARRWFYKLPPYEPPPWRKHTPKRKWQTNQPTQELPTQ